MKKFKRTEVDEFDAPVKLHIHNQERASKLSEFKTYAAAERFTEHTPFTAQQWLNIINEPGLNKLPPKDILLRLEVINDVFRINQPPLDKPPHLRVFYGFIKLTPKVIRKPSICIIYENAWTRLNDTAIKRTMDIVYTRYQNEGEENDAKKNNRMFSRYEYLINEKLWKGNIDGILYDNFVADENNVPLEERELIKKLLLEKVFSFYGEKISTQFQKTFEF